MGTQNALLRLGSRLYLEVIGPDRSQSLVNNYGGYIASLSKPQILTMVVAVQDIYSVATKVAEAGLATNGPTPLYRSSSTGASVNCTILMTKDSELGWSFPLFVDWGNSTDHPADGAPSGCSLVSAEVLHPNAMRMRKLFSTMDIDIPVRVASNPSFKVTMDTPNGPVTLNGN